MEQGIVLFLGMVRRGEFESLQKRDLPLGIIVDTNNKQKLADVSRFVLVERFDFSRPIAELIEFVRGIQQRHKLQCLFNVNELYVAATADVAAALDMPGVSPKSARLCLDKNIMRRRFEERIGPSASTSASFSGHRFRRRIARFCRPRQISVFLQPTNVSASMWATRNNTLTPFFETTIARGAMRFPGITTTWAKKTRI